MSLKNYLNEAKTLFDMEAMVELETNYTTVKKKIAMPVFANDKNEAKTKFLEKIKMLQKSGHLPKDMKITVK